MADLSTGLALGASVIVAAVSQIVTGFGFAIVLVPLLLFWAAPAQAIALAALLGAVLTTAVSLREHAYVQRKVALLLFASSLPGLPLGIAALGWLPLAWLKALVAAVVVCAVVVVLRRGIALGRAAALTALAGLLSGILLTATGMNGPPLVAAMRARGHGEREYRATLAAVFSAQGWIGFVLLALAGKVQPATLGLAGIGLLALVPGMALGAKAAERLDAGRVRQAIIVMLVVCLVSLQVK